MTLPQVLELFSYWRKNPPTHDILKAVYKIEPPKTADDLIAEGAMGPEDIMRMLDLNGGKITESSRNG